MSTSSPRRRCATAGYTGWYVLEQDAILAEEPTGEGPVADVRTSADHVRALLSKTR